MSCWGASSLGLGSSAVAFWNTHQPNVRRHSYIVLVRISISEEESARRACDGLMWVCVRHVACTLWRNVMYSLGLLSPPFTISDSNASICLTKHINLLSYLIHGRASNDAVRASGARCLCEEKWWQGVDDKVYFAQMNWCHALDRDANARKFIWKKGLRVKLLFQEPVDGFLTH